MKKILILMGTLLLVTANILMSQTYRTFTTTALAENKANPKKAVNVLSTFTFTNSNTNRVDGIYMEFNANASIVSASNNNVVYGKLTGSQTVWQISGPAFANGEQISIDVVAGKKGFKISNWCWMNGAAQVGDFNFNKASVASVPQIPMPNVANVREDVFAQKGISLIVGIASPSKKREVAWADLKKSDDIRASLEDKESEHFGQPRGFARLTNQALMLGAYKKVTPSIHNNRLFANLLALKFSVLVSDRGITPMGLGDLYYDNMASTYNGMKIREIVAHADTVMTFWRGVLKVQYEELDQVIASINAAFNGPIDTISYARQLRLTGVAPASSVPFIATTRKVIVADNTSENVPVVSELQQNYPNPFNPSTTINFSLEQPATVTLKVYNMLGEEIASLMSGDLVDKGSREVVFNGDNLSTGTYFYRLSARGTDNDYSFDKTMKMTVIK